MCRALRLALLGSLLLALPALAAETPRPMDVSHFLKSLSPLSGAENRVICPESFPNCCTPEYSDCSTTYSEPEFVRQKDNGVCVYACTSQTTCNDVNFCGGGPRVTNAFFRVRTGPVAPGACGTTSPSCSGSPFE